MQYLKKDNIYIICRTTGSQNNILGIILSPKFKVKTKSSNSIEVIEWEFGDLKAKNKVKTSKQEVLDQVIEGLSVINLTLGTDYRLAKIFFSPLDSPANDVYVGLIAKLIRHYHNGNSFNEK